MNSTDDALIGKQIGSFKVIAELGEGAYGTVYQGVHPTIGRMVAIKVLNKAWSSDRSIVNRFIDEARAANSINHPNIIQIFDFGQLDDGRFFCIMEYIQGKELNDIIEEREGLELKYVEIILPQIVSALAAAHEAKVIHRDLKPDNIMVFRDRDGIKVKILDFGIAKLLENKESATKKTQSGDIMGTPAYMAPEQARGKVDIIDARTDIYSLGVITYQMLSGRLPIDGRSIPDLLIRVLNEPPVPLSEVAPELPEGLTHFLNGALAKNQDERPSTVDEFYAGFEEAIYSDPQYAATAIEEVVSDITSVPIYVMEEHGYDKEILDKLKEKKHRTSKTEEYEVLYSSQIREDRKKYNVLNKSRRDRFMTGQAHYSSYENALQEAIHGEGYGDSQEDSHLRDSAISIREELGYQPDAVEQDSQFGGGHKETIGGDGSIISAALRKQEANQPEADVKPPSGKTVENIMFGALLLAMVLGVLYYLMVYRKSASSNDTKRSSEHMQQPSPNMAKAMSSLPMPAKIPLEAPPVMASGTMGTKSDNGTASPPSMASAACSKVFCMTKQWSVACCCQAHPFASIPGSLIATKLKARTGQIKSCFAKHQYSGVAKVTGQLRCNGTVSAITVQSTKGINALHTCVAAVVRGITFPKFRALKLNFSHTYIIN